MISPEEIKQQAVRWWPQLLQAHIREEIFFPRTIDRIGKIRAGDVHRQFEKVQAEISDLLRHSKNETGIGYTVEKSGYNFRRSGSHELPERIAIESLEDYLYVTAKKREWTGFTQNLHFVVSEIPLLKDWAPSNTSWLVKTDIEWKNILLVCRQFMSIPRPNMYIRQLPVAVHTKFIEDNSFLLQSLLDFLIPEHIRDNRQKRFSERYFLKYDEPLIRIRILDQSLSFQHNIRDLSIRLSAFQSLQLPCTRILITENKMNFLTLPDVPSAIALWSGGGFNISYLKGIDWLVNKQIHYWGDIDGHGFQILHQLRSYYPQAKSLLMDLETYKTFEQFAVKSPPAVIGELPLLDDSELNVLNMLRATPMKNRLEQERIDQNFVLGCLRSIM